MEDVQDISGGFLDGMINAVPEQFQGIVLIGVGLFALALILKLIGAALKAIVSLVMLAALVAGFIYVTDMQGWIDWPFLNGRTIDIQDIPETSIPIDTP